MSKVNYIDVTLFYFIFKRQERLNPAGSFIPAAPTYSTHEAHSLAVN